MTDLALPREVALGAAFKPADAWLLSFKLNWINWADAVKSVTLRATGPDNLAAPAVYEIVTPGDWKNQWVFASGLAYNWDDLTTLYAGHNYGSNPIPAQNSRPLLAGILEHHITLGAVPACHVEPPLVASFLSKPVSKPNSAPSQMNTAHAKMPKGM